MVGEKIVWWIRAEDPELSGMHSDFLFDTAHTEWLINQSGEVDIKRLFSDWYYGEFKVKECIAAFPHRPGRTYYIDYNKSTQRPGYSPPMSNADKPKTEGDSW